MTLKMNSSIGVILFFSNINFRMMGSKMNGKIKKSFFILTGAFVKYPASKNDNIFEKVRLI
jgi:hypothetical protein